MFMSPKNPEYYIHYQVSISKTSEHVFK